MRKKSLLFCFLCCYIIAALSSCSTSQTTIDHSESHHIDSSYVQMQLQQLVSQQQARYDSLMRVVQQRDSISQNINEQEREHITETVTSWIDSLGRKVTQEARTIDRQRDRSEELRQQRIINEQEQRIQSCQERIDSLYNLLLEKTALEVNDTTNYHKEVVKPAHTPSFLQRVHDFFTTLVNVIVFAAIFAFIIRWKRRKS